MSTLGGLELSRSATLQVLIMLAVTLLGAALLPGWHAAATMQTDALLWSPGSTQA